MASPDIVEAARTALGPIGAKIPSIGITAAPSFAVQRHAVRRLEAAGYGAAWNGEGVGGKDAFVELAVLLSATERMVFSSSIANMYARPAPTTHGAASMLAEAFPGRFVLGLGPGYPFQAVLAGQEHEPPLTRTRRYIETMTAGQPSVAVASSNYASLLAANGPKMLALAGEIVDGALPTLVPPGYVSAARALLGPHKLLAVGLLVVPDRDEDAARATATATIAGVAGFPGSPYAANLVRLGYTMDELSSGATRVIDDLAAVGSASAIVRKAQQFIDAGADHLIMTPIIPDYETCIDQLVSVGAALSEVTRP